MSLDLSWLKPMLESWPKDKSVEPFKYDYPACQKPHVQFVTSKTYLPKMAAILDRLKPNHYGVIGCLLGTTESYLLQVHGHHPRVIVCMDLDMPEYNPERDNGSYVYRNICGTGFGNFQGRFVYIRANSKETGIFQKICKYDVIFVDGEHTREAVLNDMAIANSCLNKDGVILIHDLDLHSSSVRDGYFAYLAAHPEYKHMEIPDSLFQLGLGVVWK